MIGPTLETKRLILRPPNGDDFAAYARFAADAQAMQFLGGVQSPTLAWRALAQIAGAWLINGFSMFSIVEKESGRWIGRGGPWMPESWPGHEIGWGIAPEAQRKGYAKEATSAAIDWAFDVLGWSEIIHCIDPLNSASIATAHSLGSSLQQRRVAAPEPLVATWDIYGQSKDAWRARPGWA